VQAGIAAAAKPVSATSSCSETGNEYGADAHFMVLELEPGGLAGVRGTVKYSGEFSQLA